MILTLLLTDKSLAELALPAVIAALMLVGIFIWSRRGSATLPLDKARSRPCFLLLGPTDSGKTALMNDLPRVFYNQGLTWMDEVNAGVALWRFARAEVLEVAGNLFAPANGNGADNEWKNFLTQLQRRRPRRPVDGVVLTLPLTQLAGKHALSENILKRHAAQASEQLKLLRDQFGFSLPVYLVITKCDAVPGYSTFVKEQLMPHLGEIFGWSNPYNLDAPFDPQWTTQALAEINRVLCGQRALFFARRNGASAPADSNLQDELFLFPVHLKQLQACLVYYLEQFFQQSGHRDGLQFRGIYFSGSAAQSDEAFAAIRHKSEEGHGASFTRDLFEQKIFPESGLSRPVGTAFTHRSVEVALARCLCVVAALLLFPGAILGWYNLTKSAKKIQPYLQQIQASLARAQDGVNPASAYAAIYTAQGLCGRNFQSGFLLASMLDSVENQVRETLPPVFNRLVYPGLLAELEQKTSDLIRDPAQPAEEQKTPIPASGMKPSGGQRLQNFTEALLSLQDNIVRFNSLAPAGRGQGRDMMVLASSLSPQTFADLAVRDTAAMDAIIRASFGTPFDGRPWNQLTMVRLEALVTDVLRQSMNEEQLLASLDSLVSTINLLDENKLETYEQLNGLLQLLGQVQALLAAPDLQWIARNEDQFQLPDKLTKTLDRIFSRPAQENILLCDTSQEGNSCAGQQQLKAFIEQMARAHFIDMRKMLLAYKSKTTGPLLATAEARLQLSPDAADLQTVLDNFLKLPFVAHGGTARPHDVDGTQQLFWDNDRLQAALQDKQAYDKFFGSQLSGASMNLQDTFEEVALSRLEANMLDSVASAQQFRPLASGDKTDQATIDEARSFQAVSQSLGQLLEQFSELGFDDDYQDLSRVSTGHALMMLTRLDRAFDAVHFYWPATGNFAAWTGDSLPSAASYGAHSPEEMAGYLVAQRQAVQRYASAAQPLVAYLQQNAGKAQKQASLIAKWQSIVNDVGKYESAGAASGLGSVEDFLINGLDKIVPPDCQTVASSAASRLVYFVQVRHSLERALSAQCRSLQNHVAFQQYTQVADFFNQRLAGKFPFSTADATTQEADPADVVELFRRLDADGKSIRQGLQNPAGAKITTFLNQLDGLRPLFVSLLSGEPGAPLSLDMAPVFRVNRNHEINGNQIIDWRLQVGSNTFLSTDPPSTGRWSFGEPVKLVLRWAKDSPQQPVALAPAIALPGTRTIIFEYQDAWSLLKMLAQHAAASGDFDRFADSDPQTLVFTTGQESAAVSGNGQWIETPQKETTALQIARVFIRIRIYPPGKPGALRVPAFPTQAPTP